MLTVYDYREVSSAFGAGPPLVEPFEGLELYDGKLSRTVLKGGGAAMPLPYLVTVVFFWLSTISQEFLYLINLFFLLQCRQCSEHSFSA